MAMEIKPTARVVSIFAGTALTSAATAVSSGLDLTHSSCFGLWIKGSSAGASGCSGINVWYEMSYDDTSANYVIPDGGSTILSGTAWGANTPRVVSILPPPMGYIRFKSTSTTAISADAVITAKLFIQ